MVIRGLTIVQFEAWYDMIIYIFLETVEIVYAFKFLHRLYQTSPAVNTTYYIFKI